MRSIPLSGHHQPIMMHFTGNHQFITLFNRQSQGTRTTDVLGIWNYPAWSFAPANKTHSS